MVTNPTFRIEDLKYNVLSEEFTIEDISRPGWTLKSSLGCEMDQARFFDMKFNTHCTFILVTPENERYLNKRYKKLVKLAKLAEAEAEAAKELED